MFTSHMGPVEDDAAVVYFRPETAQGSYVNFKNVQQSSRKKIPFGIAQIGKSFRNEISPGNFVFRMREFEQMEMQYFVAGEGPRRLSRKAAANVRGTAWPNAPPPQPRTTGYYAKGRGCRVSLPVRLEGARASTIGGLRSFPPCRGVGREHRILRPRPRALRTISVETAAGAIARRSRS